MIKSLVFSSVYESTNSEVTQVSQSLIDGLRIQYHEQDYIVGNLALREGIAPQKNLNTGPIDYEYCLLCYSSLLTLASSACTNLEVTVGFPFSTYHLFSDQAKQFLKNKHQIHYNTATFKKDGVATTYEVNLTEVHVIPELLGCITAIRDGDPKEKGNFFMLSLGFGTCEAALSLPEGIVQRTAVSMNGLRYAVKLLEIELSKKYYLQLKTEHQMDQIFQQGYITINRKRHDITAERKECIRRYYSDEISPRLRKNFTDDDFSKTTLMYIAGGGAYYKDLLDCIKAEYGDILNVHVYADPEKCASHGYCLYTYNNVKNNHQSESLDVDWDNFLEDSGKSLAVGIDIGNSYCCVSYIEGSN